ncbi:hypothetical protein FRC07_011290, partial [Ceratobasidium sp. 392]
MAAAYQTRKEAWLLLAKSAEQKNWRDLFTKAAEEFFECAARTRGKQQTVCYLRAAECFLQTEKWDLAANAFVSAEEFGLAAKNFCRGGIFVEAVDLVKKHKAEIQEDVADEVIKMARLGGLRQSQLGNTEELVDSVERQLACMEGRGSSGVAAAELADRNLLEYIRLLSTSSEDRMRQVLAHILRGLWISLPFGSTKSQLDNPAVTSLLEQSSRLDLRAVSDDERRQLELFRVIHSQDMDKIISLAQENNLASRSSEAVLCFGHCIHNLVSLQNTTLSTFISKSALALAYYTHLARLALDSSTPSLDIQRLLGFELIPPDTNTSSTDEPSSTPPNYRLFSSSLMFRDKKTAFGDAEPIPTMLGLTAVTLSWRNLDCIRTVTLLAKLKSEVQAIRVIANTVRCIYPDGLSNNTRQTHFNERLRAHILQISIIHWNLIDDTSEELIQKMTWIQRLYEVLAPHFPPLGNALCIELAKIPEYERGSDIVSDWCRRNLERLRPGSTKLSRWFLSNFLVSLELAHRIRPQDFADYGPRLHSKVLTWNSPSLQVHTPNSSDLKYHSIVDYLIEFYIDESDKALKHAILAIHHIMFKPLTIEVNVLVNLFETITRGVIVQSRWQTYGRRGVFNGLLLPQSWALDIVTHLPKVNQQGWALQDLLEALYKALEYM